MNEKNANKPAVNITVVSPEALKGSYANTVKVLANENEVTIDFAFITSEEGQTSGVLTSRIVCSPKFAKGAAELIINTIKNHEAKVAATKTSHTEKKA